MFWIQKNLSNGEVSKWKWFPVTTGRRNIQKFWATKKPSNPPKEELNIQEPL